MDSSDRLRSSPRQQFRSHPIAVVPGSPPTARVFLGFDFPRFAVTFVLALALSASQAGARTFDEAVEELAAQLGRQLAQQEVGSFGALQFSNRDGAQRGELQ